MRRLFQHHDINIAPNQITATRQFSTFPPSPTHSPPLSPLPPLVSFFFSSLVSSSQKISTTTFVWRLTIDHTRYGLFPHQILWTWSSPLSPAFCLSTPICRFSDPTYAIFPFFSPRFPPVLSCLHKCTRCHHSDPIAHFFENIFDLDLYLATIQEKT